MGDRVRKRIAATALLMAVLVASGCSSSGDSPGDGGTDGDGGGGRDAGADDAAADCSPPPGPTESECAEVPDSLTDATPVDWSTYTPPSECVGPAERIAGATSQTIDSEAAFHEVFECTPADTPSGIDFTEQRLEILVLSNQPYAEVQWVVQQDGQTLVGTSNADYCGGALPPPTVLYVLLPADAPDAVVRPCMYDPCPPCGGECGPCPA